MRHAKRAAPAAAAVAFLDADKCDTKRMMAKRSRGEEEERRLGVACGLQPCKERETQRGRDRERKSSITYTCALLLRPFSPASLSPLPPPHIVLVSVNVVCRPSSVVRRLSSVVGGPAANVSAKYETEKSIKSTLLRQPIAGKLNETTEKAHTHTHRGMVVVVVVGGG